MSRNENNETFATKAERPSCRSVPQSAKFESFDRNTPTKSAETVACSCLFLCTVFRFLIMSPYDYEWVNLPFWVCCWIGTLWVFFFLFWLPFAMLLLMNRIPNPTYLCKQTAGSCSKRLHCHLHARTGIWEVQAQRNSIQASQPAPTPYVTEYISEFKVGPARLQWQLRLYNGN